MPRIAALVLLAAAALLAACATPGQTFSCGPTLGSFHVDTQQYTRAATIGPGGYAHC